MKHSMHFIREDNGEEIFMSSTIDGNRWKIRFAVETKTEKGFIEKEIPVKIIQMVEKEIPREETRHLP